MRFINYLSRQKKEAFINAIIYGILIASTVPFLIVELVCKLPLYNNVFKVVFFVLLALFLCCTVFEFLSIRKLTNCSYCLSKVKEILNTFPLGKIIKIDLTNTYYVYGIDTSLTNSVFITYGKKKLDAILSECSFGDDIILLTCYSHEGASKSHYLISCDDLNELLDLQEFLEFNS